MADEEICCTFAVTGDRSYYQVVYLCRDCSASNEPLCVCENCAESCHADHEVDYLGMGEAYCDCNKLSGGSCKLSSSSEEVVRRLKVGVPLRAYNPPLNLELKAGTQNNYIFEASIIEELRNDELVRAAREQCTELVKHSRDTFWLSEDPGSDGLLLERMAWMIFQKHLVREKEALDTLPVVGCEWWVQVKNMASEGESSKESAVDMHYDKDEVLAEKFSLGVFPAFSTVTYLSADETASPTLIVSRRYDEEDDESIGTAYVSHPEQGKHVVFDGRLLHGAPSHERLRKRTTIATSKTRVTFLVNVWLGHKPAGVHSLSNSIKTTLQSSSNSVDCFESLTFIDLPVESIAARDDVTQSKLLSLPFVGSNTTWGEDFDDDNLTVLQMTALPSTDALTYRIDYTEEGGPRLVNASNEDGSSVDSEHVADG